MTRSLTINDKMYNFNIQPNGCYIGYKNGVMIVSGYASSYDNAVSAVDNYIDNLLGKTTKVEEVKSAPIVEEPVVEDTVDEIVEETTKEEQKIIVTADKNEDDTFTVTLNYDVEGAVIKYTTNGKDVVSSSKIYKEAFSVAEGTIINANAYVNKEVVASLKSYEVK